jgi:Zinc-finger of C2H2 type
MVTLGDKNSAFFISKFFCEFCDYKTSKKSSYDSHISSLKHQKSILGDKNSSEQKKNLPTGLMVSCPTCSKQYYSRNGLWKHRKQCVATEPPVVDTEINKNIIDMLLKQNSELMDLIKKGTMNISNNTINHSNNKTFNLNVFLNETCKDAMNMDDFVKSIKVSLEDLEHTGEKGYVEGISNIFIKNLNNLEQHMRPIHCNDSKREVFYIKNNDKWIKETNDKPNLIKAIKNVAHENVKQIKAWTEKYPDCIKSNSNKNDTYLKIVSNAMNGYTDEESAKNIHKIINIISKEVTIDKQSALLKMANLK